MKALHSVLFVVFVSFILLFCMVKLFHLRLKESRMIENFVVNQGEMDEKVQKRRYKRMEKGINSEFVKLLEDPKVKFTVILGAGFHRQALGGNSVLSDWGTLLGKLTNTNKLANNYILDFEKIVLDECAKQKSESVKKAFEIEKKELGFLVKAIQNEQDWVLSQPQRFEYPNIFQSNRISDVISLNFDTIAEKICFPGSKKSTLQNSSSFALRNTKGKLSDSFITQVTSCQELVNSSNHSIRFWHPHGSINNPKHIVLGVAKYSKLVASTLKIRNHYKANESLSKDTKEQNEITWFSQIYNNPVLILGASMSEMEWAMWTAFVHKNRNFAKPKNKEFSSSIFHMMSPEDSKDKAKQKWFQPLFFNMEFENQWKELEYKHFKKNGL